MKRCTLLIFVFSFIFNMAFSQKAPYEINAYEGAYFYCCLEDGVIYPSICTGIILDSDSTLLMIDSEKNFYKSLFKNARFVQDNELFYAQAYNIIFPGENDIMNNYELAQELRINFSDLFYQHEKYIEFKLDTGKTAKISFCKVKGIFLSILDEKTSKQFKTSLDVDKTLLPQFDSVNIPLAVFECIASEHKFLINDTY